MIRDLMEMCAWWTASLMATRNSAMYSWILSLPIARKSTAGLQSAWLIVWSVATFEVNFVGASILRWKGIGFWGEMMSKMRAIFFFVALMSNVRVRVGVGKPSSGSEKSTSGLRLIFKPKCVRTKCAKVRQV